MFDDSGAGDVTFPALDPQSIDAVRNSLSAALESPSGLTDATCVEAIRALERLACVVTAAQARLSLELDQIRRDTRAEEGVPADQQGRGNAHEVAQARRESPHRAQRHLALARAVIGEMP